MSDLPAELRRLLNQHNAERISNTPDYILAMFLNTCLNAFNVATLERQRWYGEQRIGPAVATGVTHAPPVGAEGGTVQPREQPAEDAWKFNARAWLEYCRIYEGTTGIDAGAAIRQVKAKLSSQTSEYTAGAVSVLKPQGTEETGKDRPAAPSSGLAEQQLEQPK